MDSIRQFEPVKAQHSHLALFAEMVVLETAYQRLLQSDGRTDTRVPRPDLREIETRIEELRRLLPRRALAAGGPGRESLSKIDSGFWNDARVRELPDDAVLAFFGPCLPTRIRRRWVLSVRVSMASPRKRAGQPDASARPSTR